MLENNNEVILNSCNNEVVDMRYGYAEHKKDFLGLSSSVLLSVGEFEVW